MAKDLVQEKFSAAAADYAASRVHARGPSLARVVELIAPRSDWRALDIATGAGHTAAAVAPHVNHVVASDITAEMLVEAAKLADRKGLRNFEVAHAEAGALPFADLSFDLVTCRLAAHHFPDPRAFVSEAWRVLHRGGLLALVDNISPDSELAPRASEAALRAATVAYNDFEKLRDPSHGRCLGLGEWRAMLEAAGFAIVHAEHMDQEIAFDPWTQRMRCDEATVDRLRAMLNEEPLRSFLRPYVSEEGLSFTLQEAIIVARRPTQ